MVMEVRVLMLVALLRVLQTRALSKTTFLPIVSQWHFLKKTPLCRMNQPLFLVTRLAKLKLWKPKE